MIVKNVALPFILGTLVFIGNPLTAFVCLVSFFIGYCLFTHWILDTNTSVDLSPFLVGSSWLTAEEQVKRGKEPRSDSSASGCSICNQPNCIRDSLRQKRLPWRDLRIPKCIDAAVEEFIDLTLKTYVHSWYLDISRDESFLLEIRYHIRFLAASVYSTLLHFDLTDWILRKAAPIGSSHAEVYMRVRQRFGSQFSPDALEERVVEELRRLGTLHRAVFSRDSELAYLRQLADCLVTRLMDEERVAGWAPRPPRPNPDWALSPRRFLRELCLFAFLLPVMDILADPDIINKLLILLFDPTPITLYSDPPMETVEVLESLTSVSPNQATDSLVQIKLSEIMREPAELYKFMNYLKAIRGPMHHLQFILSASELQERLSILLHNPGKMDPEVGGGDAMAHLHWEAWELFKSYFHGTAPDRIEFPPELVVEFQTAVESPSDDAAPLVEHALLKAYRMVYHWLQFNHVIPFCQSEEFLGHVSGDRPDEFVTDSTRETAKKHPTSNHRRKTQLQSTASNSETGFTLAKFRNRLTGVFRSTVEDGHVPPSVHLSVPDILVSGTLPSDLLNEDFIDLPNDLTVFPTVLEEVDGADEAGLPRNLNQWRTKIPKVEPRREPQSGRTMYVYVVSVEREDVPADLPNRCWTVDRRYAEFYVLESKMLEFHGESVVGPMLPAKKTFANKGRAFVESLRPAFEGFLQRLAVNPVLKGSELLHAFLTSSEEFTSNILPNSINPWRAMKKVPAKLARERGQNLNSLISRLCTSIDPESAMKMSKSKSSIFESICEVRSESSGVSSISDKQLTRDKIYGSVFQNNCGLQPSPEPAPTTWRVAQDSDALWSSLYDLCLFVAAKVLHLSRAAFLLLVSLRVLLRRAVDRLVYLYLQHVLRRALHELQVTELVELVRDAVFYEESVSRGPSQRRRRRTEAQSFVSGFFSRSVPKLALKFLGEEKVMADVDALFQGLQHPKLNKQVSYVLLDSLVIQLFPDILYSSDPSHSSSCST